MGNPFEKYYPNNHRGQRLSIDIGGVLGKKYKDRLLPDGTFNYTSPPTDGASEFMREAVREYGHKNVDIISRVTEAAQVAANWQWLVYQGFFATGLLPENVIIFVGEDADKAKIIENRRVTCHLDDLYQVLEHLLPMIKRVAFRPNDNARNTEDALKRAAVGNNFRIIFSFDEFWGVASPY